MSSSPPELEEHRIWKAGTLAYTRKDLLRLGFWLVFGQFTTNLEYIAMPVLLPLLFKAKGFDAEQIGMLLAVFPLGALLMVPIIGTWSDRLRTRWGRRRPIILSAAPIWFVGLCWLPFTKTYWETFAAMVLVGFAGAAGNVLSCFYNDVIPPSLMGRFSSILATFGAIGGLTFQFGGMRYFDGHPEFIFILLAAVGFSGEMLMLIMVREGDYPPASQRKPFMKTLTEFIREGFGNRYIVLFWLTLGMTALGGPVMGNYFNLFLSENLKLNSSEMGMLLGAGTAVGLLFILPVGWTVDEFGPKKIWIVASTIVGATQIVMFFASESRVLIYGTYLVYAIANTMLAATLLPVLFAFLPQQKFGQLNGAGQIATRALSIVGAAGCGIFIQQLHNNYSYIFVLGGVIYLLTPVLLYLTLRQPYPYPDSPSSVHPGGRRGRILQDEISRIELTLVQDRNAGG